MTTAVVMETGRVFAVMLTTNGGLTIAKDVPNETIAEQIARVFRGEAALRCVGCEGVASHAEGGLPYCERCNVGA